MNVTIRKAVQQDYPAVLSLIKEFAIFQKAPEKVSITLEQMIADKNLFRCIVAETNAQIIVGFSTFFLAYYSWTGRALYLDDLYVSAPFRKQGIGKKLLNSVIHLARDEKCTKVRWQVSSWNTEAIQFYERMGAVIDETERNCDYKVE